MADKMMLVRQFTRPRIMPAVTPIAGYLASGSSNQALEPVRLHPDVHLSTTPAMTDQPTATSRSPTGRRRGDPQQSAHLARPAKVVARCNQKARRKPRRRSPGRSAGPNTAAGAAGGMTPQGALSAGLGATALRAGQDGAQPAVSRGRPSTRCQPTRSRTWTWCPATSTSRPPRSAASTRWSEQTLARALHPV